MPVRREGIGHGLVLQLELRAGVEARSRGESTAFVGGRGRRFREAAQARFEALRELESAEYFTSHSRRGRRARMNRMDTACVLVRSAEAVK